MTELKVLGCKDIISQMSQNIVVKALDLMGGHLWDNGYDSMGMTLSDAVHEAKVIRESGVSTYLPYIGEIGQVEVDLQKIKCPDCRKRLERLL